MKINKTALSVSYKLFVCFKCDDFVKGVMAINGRGIILVWHFKIGMYIYYQIEIHGLLRAVKRCKQTEDLTLLEWSETTIRTPTPKAHLPGRFIHIFKLIYFKLSLFPFASTLYIKCLCVDFSTHITKIPFITISLKLMFHNNSTKPL